MPASVLAGRRSWALAHGDCVELLPRFPEGAIDAIVTSPPYLDQRAYGDQRRRTGYATRSRMQRRAEALTGPWFDFIGPILEECLRVVSPAGSMMLNLGRVMRDGEEHPYALETLLLARELGWRWVDTIIWYKPNAIPLSCPDYLHGKHEWVWWLAKTTKPYRGFDRDTRVPHSETTLRRRNDVYVRDRSDERYAKRGGHGPGGFKIHPDGARPASVFTAGVGDEKGVKHPAKMAKKTALQLVSLSCPPGGVVLDPMCGSGTTGIAALERGRRFVGLEKEAAYLPECRERLERAAAAGVPMTMEVGGV